MTELERSLPRPRSYRLRPLLTGALGAALVAGAFLLGTTRVPPAAPLVIMAPPVAVPAPLVTVNVPPPPPAPPPIVVEPPAPPPPAPVPPPRALSPKLDAACVLQAPNRAKSCDWDDGFPAISADGTLIATKFVPDAGESDMYGLSIHLIDVHTSRVVRDATILAPAESEPLVYVNDGDAAADPAKVATTERLRARTQAKIAARVAAIQATLDAGKFRTLVPLGSQRPGRDDDDPPPPPTTQIYGELDGANVRIVDPLTATVVWRGNFEVSRPTPRKEDEECGGWGLWNLAVWWDPQTKHVLATPMYRTGGCMCADVTLERVQ